MGKRSPRWPAGVPIVRNRCCVFAVTGLDSFSDNVKVQWVCCFAGFDPHREDCFWRVSNDLFGANAAGRAALEIARGG